MTNPLGVAVELVEKMLTVDPQQRITAAEAIEHRWITGETKAGSEKPAATSSQSLPGQKRSRTAETQVESDEDEPATKKMKSSTL